MAWYINSEPTENGSYGNPQSKQREDTYKLPDELLSDYIATKGFAKLTVEDGTVIDVEVNQEALDAYLAEHPVDIEPEMPEPTLEERNRADIDYLAVMIGIDLA